LSLAKSNAWPWPR